MCSNVGLCINQHTKLRKRKAGTTLFEPFYPHIGIFVQCVLGVWAPDTEEGGRERLAGVGRGGGGGGYRGLYRLVTELLQQ